jgi:hypothetical protein
MGQYCCRLCTVAKWFRLGALILLSFAFCSVSVLFLVGGMYFGQWDAFFVGAPLGIVGAAGVFWAYKGIVCD